jgi:hypothetical protein
MGKTNKERRKRRKIFEAEWKLGGFRDRWSLGLVSTFGHSGVHIFRALDEGESIYTAERVPLCGLDATNGNMGRVREVPVWPEQQTKQSYPRKEYSGVCKSCVGQANARIERELNERRRYSDKKAD